MLDGCGRSKQAGPRAARRLTRARPHAAGASSLAAGARSPVLTLLTPPADRGSRMYSMHARTRRGIERSAGAPEIRFVNMIRRLKRRGVSQPHNALSHTGRGPASAGVAWSLWKTLGSTTTYPPYRLKAVPVAFYFYIL